MVVSPGEFVNYLLPLVPAGICVVASLYTCFCTTHGFHRVPLLDHEFLDFMPGIDRLELEEQLANEARWTCAVCAFKNLDTTLECNLCGTGQPKAGGQEPLTTPQRLARRRRRWTRDIDDDNRRVVWTDVGANSIMDRSWVLEVVSSASFGLAGSDSDLECCIRIALTPSSTSAKGPPPAATSVWPDVASMPLKLQWSPSQQRDANCTMLGKALSVPVWEGLVAISRLMFSSKYAWFLQQVADMRLPVAELRLEVKSCRMTLLADATATLLDLQGPTRCAIARHQFDGEVAIDAGAVQREWYTLVAQAWMDPATTGLFDITNRTNNSYYVNPKQQHNDNSKSHLEQYRAFGRFLGRALLDGQVLPIQLNPVLFQLLLGIPVEFEDLECLDPVVFKSLTYVLECQDVAELCLTFCATNEYVDGHVEEVDLIDGGRHICVDKTNRVQYVETMTKYLICGRIQDPLMAMVKGLYDIVPPELLVIFDHKELELILCGLAVVDVQDWKRNTVTSPNLTQTRLVDWFWDVVGAMETHDQAKLLQFTTGSSRVPVQGFKGLTSYDGRICYFTLNGVAYAAGKYPVVHACFNRLDLPLYPTKDLLQDALSTLLLSDPTGFNTV
ncbi:hypothetical protein H257_19072 [Aphanomyces astaci]|uniref:HECT-type E3 ubiquitin transferase n=1 Tax=Aphanomyces astaci TaxID=112090 RepID=W4F964_APHAT|nr:hypothetical protein H257_19072 [Aphanomyces astaci]ETV63992.1 hypothetical protein H257_19072 [Aphanomyces astaci]|eukprot:XP_009846523.1 hypothetical protein H257_19072 [Aphanomyces astaci]